MFRGESAFSQADKANAEAKSRGSNAASQRRFYLPQGAQSEILILDDKIIMGMFEHDIDIPGKKYKKYVPCIGSLPGMTCPICKAGNQHRYRMFLSVLDLSGYTSKKGTEVKYSKKLLPISQGDKERWQSIQQDVIKLHGTMRGTYLLMKRPNEQRSARIGEPFAIEGRLWQWTGNEELKKYAHKARLGSDGKLMAPANDDITPYDYNVIFPFPDEAFIASLESEYGNGLPDSGGEHSDAEPGEAAHMGSASEIDSAWNEEIEEGNPDEIPMEFASDEAPVDHTGLGEQADAGDTDSASTLTELAVQHGLDVEAYPSWTGVEEAIEHMVNPPPAPRPAVKKAMVRPAAIPAKKIASPAPAAAPARKLALTRPGAAPAAAPKPGGLVRPNRGAFNG